MHLYESSFYNVDILSTTVAKALRFTFKDAAEETARFVETADKMFDCFNVPSFSQGKKKRKAFQQPYRNKPDFGKDPDFRLEVTISFVTTVSEFLKNSQSLSVVDSICVKDITGQRNCRGTKERITTWRILTLKCH